MKHPEDKAAAEIPGLPAATERAPRPRKYASDAEKQAAYRARKEVTAVTVMLPNQVAADFRAWLADKGKQPSPVIAKLIQTQLLRKR